MRFWMVYLIHPCGQHCWMGEKVVVYSKGGTPSEHRHIFWWMWESNEAVVMSASTESCMRRSGVVQLQGPSTALPWKMLMQITLYLKHISSLEHKSPFLFSKKCRHMYCLLRICLVNSIQPVYAIVFVLKCEKGGMYPRMHTRKRNRKVLVWEAKP